MEIDVISLLTGAVPPAEWNLQELEAVVDFIVKSGYPAVKPEPGSPVAQYVLNGGFEQITTRLKELSEDHLNSLREEVYKGYDRKALLESILEGLEAFLEAEDVANEVPIPVLAGLGLISKTNRFPISSKINPKPFPARVPPLIEAYYRVLAIYGKPYVELDLAGRVFELGAAIESTGPEAKSKDLVEFLNTAPYHWLEFWATARTTKGENCFPNTYVAALLFEQKFGYLPNFRPDSELSRGLKQMPRPAINISWARQGFCSQNPSEGRDNRDLIKFGTPKSIFTPPEEPVKPVKRKPRIW